MKTIYLLAFLISNFLNFSFIYAQQDNSSCKVTQPELAGTYTGDCKNGFANGKGDAKGLYHYTGSFKDGMPNGEGIYYFSDSEYYRGNFQDGIKEGKGEMHYVRKGMPDSIVNGYWSAGEFKGKKYTTYAFTTTEQFDATRIIPTSASGNTITIEIGTTSGSPNGVSTGLNSGYVLSLTNIVSPTGCILKTLSKYESSFKSYVTLQLVGFPCTLLGTLSDNQTFELQLFKAANWKVSFYRNK
jgi:Uncharacterized protein conserved in bacteria